MTWDEDDDLFCAGLDGVLLMLAEAREGAVDGASLGLFTFLGVYGGT